MVASRLSTGGGVKKLNDGSSQANSGREILDLNGPSWLGSKWTPLKSGANSFIASCTYSKWDIFAYVYRRRRRGADSHVDVAQVYNLRTDGTVLDYKSWLI